MLICLLITTINTIVTELFIKGRKLNIYLIFVTQSFSSTILKQKKIIEELANGRKGIIQNLSKQINFNNLIYYFKSKSVPKIFISFRGPLGFHKNIKDVYTLEKAEQIKNHI